MSQTLAPSPHNPVYDLWTDPVPTGVLVLADGTVIYGQGFGYKGSAEAEVCFNTALTGYQEILTDPSYAGQIVTFTFPHIGNVGANDDDVETVEIDRVFSALGCIIKADITTPSNWRAMEHFADWAARRKIIGLRGIDTRALTAHIRQYGALNAVIAYDPQGQFDLESLKARAAGWKGLENTDMVPGVTRQNRGEWHQSSWSLDPLPDLSENRADSSAGASQAIKHIVAFDYGVKCNILRLFADLNTKLTLVPASTSASDILALGPDGVFLSNGPGDPFATGHYAIQTIQNLLEADIPLFGICLGHQLLALALGAKTVKMHQGHHGANHPVKDLTTGKVEIVSMNHGFTVDRESLPDTVMETHISLFDGTNCGIAHKSKPAFSVQYHPEASPGPHDSHYLFQRFYDLMG
jgi:carbamoyl-phosphate synthase small subunit